MSLLSLFKLEKLTVTAHKTDSRSDAAPPKFEAMFNPTSYSQSLANKWDKKQGLNASSAELEYVYGCPTELNFTLLLDDTGVDEMGIFALGRDSLKVRLKKFSDVAHAYNGSIHEPHYLLVEWGTLSFACRLSKAEIKYTLFDRDGTPLRAELEVNFISDESAKTRAQKENKQSPDLTHSRTVRRGDTLPLMVKEIYGSTAHYLDIARYNKLDDFRNLIPGQQILFPPLTTFTEQGG